MTCWMIMIFLINNKKRNLKKINGVVTLQLCLFEGSRFYHLRLFVHNTTRVFITMATTPPPPTTQVAPGQTQLDKDEQFVLAYLTKKGFAQAENAFKREVASRVTCIRKALTPLTLLHEACYTFGRNGVQENARP